MPTPVQIELGLSSERKSIDRREINSNWEFVGRKVEAELNRMTHAVEEEADRVV
jgi:hypothetical protein